MVCDGVCGCVLFVFFFKQKTAYEMRISDWSSDVCSSDLFLLLTAITFSLFGFIIGIWADGFEKLQIVPLMIVTPLTFLGGSFYSISMLPSLWQKIALLNPVVYLISGFRWSFYDISDVSITLSISKIGSAHV